MEWSKAKGVEKHRIRAQGRNTCAWMMMSVHAYKCTALTYSSVHTSFELSVWMEKQTNRNRNLDMNKK